MRLSSYLNESRSLVDSWNMNADEIINILQNDCRKFLNEKPPKVFLYRAVKRLSRSDSIFKFKARKDRKPRDTPIEIHAWMDDMFYEEFGWYPRSEGVFATTSLADAEDYGIPYLFFPIGNYKYIYNDKVDDLFRYTPSSLNTDYERITPNAKATERLEKMIRNEYKSSGLKNAMRGTNVEFMFKCDYYYLVEYNLYFKLQDKL